MKCNENGFTLIEVIVTLVILLIVTSFIITFFIICYNNFININNNSELQFQTQFILNFMSNKIMQSNKIEFARQDTKDIINASRELSVSKISFRYGDRVNHCYNFEIRNNKVFYNNNNYIETPNIELGVYVSDLKVTPYPAGCSFATAKAIKLKLYLKKGLQEYEAEQLIYMRNS